MRGLKPLGRENVCMCVRLRALAPVCVYACVFLCQVCSGDIMQRFRSLCLSRVDSCMRACTCMTASLRWRGCSPLRMVVVVVLCIQPPYVGQQAGGPALVSQPQCTELVGSLCVSGSVCVFCCGPLS